MVEDEATGALLNYNWVGYVAVFMTVLSVWMGSKLIAIDD
jgi:hypothetical protein